MELEVIKSKIYEIRGQRVMLDRDLAQMYGVETKNLNKAVKRNLERFEGEDFMFKLTKDECLRFQIGTLNLEIRFQLIENKNLQETYLYFSLLLYLYF